jgi:hypothetical protein
LKLCLTNIMSQLWNSDERSTECGLTPCFSSEPEYIPVYKILKEMYDEDKERLYCFTTESKVETLDKKSGLRGKGLAKYTARLVRKMDMNKTVSDDFAELDVSEGDGEGEEPESEPEPQQEPEQEQVAVLGETESVPDKGTQKQDDDSPTSPENDPDGISKRFWYT